MPSVPRNEKERLAALREYQILDTETEPEFDEITTLASEICQAPISMITLVDEERQWIKSSANLPVREMPRTSAFCAHAILFPHDPFVVSDMRKDERFRDHPFVQGDPHLVFFAGIPLTNPDGFALGTLCVLDKRPRLLTDSQLRALTILARQVIHLLELRKANFRLKSLKSDLESRYEELQQFAFVISHDIKSPLASIVLSGEMLREHFGKTIDEDNDQLLQILSRSSLKIRNLVDGVLAYYRSEWALGEGSESFELLPFLFSIAEMFNTNNAVDIQLPTEDRNMVMNKTALEQILVNLVQNAIKYNDKDKPVVQIRFSEDDSNYYFVVIDNGKGIAPEEQKKIFELFTTLGQRDRFGTQGSGIGLSTVKKLVEKLSGTVVLKSKPGEGSEFSFSIKKRH
ncbi:MAG TPA: GAF domain-containing sensor histidine kinase [Puia sp.]